MVEIHEAFVPVIKFLGLILVLVMVGPMALKLAVEILGDVIQMKRKQKHKPVSGVRQLVPVDFVPEHQKKILKWMLRGFGREYYVYPNIAVSRLVPGYSGEFGDSVDFVIVTRRDLSPVAVVVLSHDPNLQNFLTGAGYDYLFFDSSTKLTDKNFRELFHFIDWRL